MLRLLLGILLAGFLINFSIIDVEAQKGWKSYTVPDGYSFKYPSNWKLEQRENRFSTIDAKLFYGQFNDVRMTFEGGNKSDFGLSGSDSELMDSMETAMTERYDASLFENGSNKYMINNRSAPYVIGTYTGEWSTNLLTGDTTGIDWAVMFVGVYVKDDQIVIVQYTTEKDDFDKYLEKAEKIFQSVTPVNSTI